MYDESEVNDQREQQLQAYYKRQIGSLMRKERYLPKVAEALAVTQDTRLPRMSLELGPCEEYVAGRWIVPEGLGAAFENYVARLREMELVRFSHSSIGLTGELQRACSDVIESARVLEDMGWPVN